MKRALWLFLAVSLGALAGLGLTFAAVEWPPGFGVVSTGSWITRPGIGSTSADPYSRALIAYHGEIPMAAAEGVMLTASRDSDGQLLDLRCTYAVAGAVPAASYWTLALYRHDGALVPEVRQSMTSSEALFSEDGTASIMLSPDPHAGNWIPLRGAGPFVLYLRLYETQVSSSALALDKVAAPAIRRQGCR